jgi:O-antigen/teichoic acid export membrane protein
MVTGTLVAALGNYVYQLLGGRSLGPEEFAPVGSLLTLSFLAFAVVLVPIEQLVIRSVTMRGGFDRSPRNTITVAVLATIALTVLIAALGVDQLFGGQRGLVLLVGASVATHALFVVGRGRLAGDRRFRSYGLATAGVSMLRLSVALVIVFVAPTAVGLAAALAVGPLIILLWASSLRTPEAEVAESDENPAHFLASFVLAAAASQVLLLAGPLVAGALGAAAVQISVVYVTLTISRTPLVLGYSLISRVLPPFTNLAKLGMDTELNRWVARIGGTGALLAIPAGALGAWIGPDIVAFLFGEGFRPASPFAALAAAGVVLGGAAMFLGQVLVARGQTSRLAIGWVLALTAALLALFVTDADIPTRIGVAFLAGEFVAMTATGTLAHRSSGVEDEVGAGQTPG